MSLPRLATLTVLLVLAGCGQVQGVADAARTRVQSAVSRTGDGPCSPANETSPGIENLGSCVNSEFQEGAPLVSPDGQTLYLGRDNHPQNTAGTQAGTDIWVSTRQPDGAWGRARNIGAPLNNGGHNFVVSALPDGNTLVLGNTYTRDGAGGPGVSISRRGADGAWGFPETLRISNYRSLASYVFYRMSSDGRTLLLIMQASPGRTDGDVYVSFIQRDGSWSEPRDLGPAVNSPANEHTPFLADDGQTLYFSSQGHGGLGDFDVFVSRRLDDTWTTWSTPENLGAPINSSGAELSFTLPASGEAAYFETSYNSLGRNDIVRVAVPEAARPRPVALVSGRVLDAATGAPLTATITYEAIGGSERGTANSDPETGAYRIVLPAGARYGFRAEAPRYYAESTTLDLAGLAGYEEQAQDLRLTPLAVGTTVRLNNLFFDTARATLRPESAAELDRLAAFLAGNPATEIEIAGHTDNEGSDASNQTLSQNRAAAVVTYLTSHGVAARRLAARGYGEAAPVGSNDTVDGRQLNRRVEFKVTKL